MTELCEYQRVRVIGTEIVGRITMRRQAELIDDAEAAAMDMPKFRDYGPKRLVDPAGQYAVEVKDRGRYYWVFARAEELEAA